MQSINPWVVLRYKGIKVTGKCKKSLMGFKICDLGLLWGYEILTFYGVKDCGKVFLAGGGGRIDKRITEIPIFDQKN